MTRERFEHVASEILRILGDVIKKLDWLADRHEAEAKRRSGGI